MPLAPGMYVNDVDVHPAGDQGPDTGTAFAVIYTEKGPDDQAVLCQSLSDFQRVFGQRLAVSPGYDWVDTFFKLGGSRLYVSRNIVSTTVAASAALAGTGGTTLTATAVSKGTHANGLTVTVEVGSGTYVLVHKNAAGQELERSFPLASRDEAVSWAQAYSNLIRYTAGVGTGNPTAVSNTALTGGTDDTATTATTLETALARFDDEKGPGLVVAPGATASALHKKVVAHCAGRPRTFSLDLADGPATTAVSAAQGLYLEPKVDRGTLNASVLVLPGGVLGATREVGWSAVIAAHAALADRLSAPGQALAGPTYGAVLDNGSPIPGATVKRRFTDAERATLDDAGVTVGTTGNIAGASGVPQTFSDRTITAYQSQTQYTEFSDARIRMALEARGRFALAPSQFRQLGGRGVTVAQANGRVSGLAQDMWREDVLDGADYGQAYTYSVVADKPNKKLVVTLKARSAVSARVIEINIVRPYQGA